MWYKYATTVGLVLALLGLASTVVFAQDAENVPGSSGVIATVIAIDANTTVATLQTEAGEVFELPQRPQWHVGHKVLCNRQAVGPRPRLQGCQLWEEGHAGVPSPAPGRFADTEPPRATPKGLFSTTD